jgi:hypothetical protein
MRDMITLDKIHKVLDEAETYAVPAEFDGERNNQILFLISKALIFAIIYAAEHIARSLRGSS